MTIGVAPCEECGLRPRMKKWRFCAKCKRALFKRMEDEGRLDRVQRYRRPRLRDQQQDMSREPSGAQENAVRAMEGS